jgi:hypothetical protein
MSGRKSSLFKVSNLDDIGNLAIPTKRVRKLHLTRRSALRLQQSRAPHNDAQAASARSGDIEPVQTVKKLHTLPQTPPNLTSSVRLSQARLSRANSK